MTTETSRQGRWTVPRPLAEECDRRPSEFLAAVRVVGAAAGICLTAELADAFAHPTAWIPMVTTVALTLRLLTWLAAAAWSVMARANSRDCHVFRAERVVGRGLFLAIVGAVLAAALVDGQPFEHLASTFRIGAGDIADFALLLAAITCLGLAGTALVAAWGLWREEHRWADQLPVD